MTSSDLVLLRRLLVAAMAAAALVSAVGARAEPARWLDGQLAIGDSERNYKLYLPANTDSGPRPLVVMLHGCGQSPDAFALSTRMNAHADTGQFLVLYPAQRFTANPARCWNWFLPRNQARGSGEPAEIVALVDHVARQYAVDRQRIYVAGLSAGATMSATLAACYPDVFAAAAVVDGTMYKSAGTLLEARKVMAKGEAPDPTELGTAAWACGGQRPLMVPVAVWHGLGDKVVHPVNGDSVLRQFATFNDLADDGRANGSVAATPEVHTDRVDGGYAWSVSRYAWRGHPMLEYYRVDTMGHAWSGGKDELPFSDAKGPDASLLIWNFFRQFRR